MIPLLLNQGGHPDAGATLRARPGPGQVNWTNEDKLFTFSPDMVGKNKGLLNIPVFVLPAYSLKIIRAANLSKLSSYLLGNWSGEFEKELDQLRTAIVTVNSTRVNSSIAEGLSSWIRATMEHLKEWAGIGSLLGLMAIASLVCLWCFCNVQSNQRRNAMMVMQAFAAIEEGQSPSAWLATFKN